MYSRLFLAAPHTPVNWMKKKNKVLGNLSTFQSLLVHCLEVFLEEDSSDATGLALASVMSALFTNFSLPNTVTEALNSLVPPLTLFCKQAASEPPKFSSQLQAKVGSSSYGDTVINTLHLAAAFIQSV